MKSPTAVCSRIGAGPCTPGSRKPSSALYADRLAEQVERLAHHAVRGEMWDKAVATSARPGPRHRRGGATGGRRCFERALEALAALPETRERLEQAIDLRLDLRNALIRSEIGRAWRITSAKRRHLARTLGDQLRLGRDARPHGEPHQVIR